MTGKEHAQLAVRLADNLKIDNDHSKGYERALLMIDAAGLFLSERYGPEIAAEEFYRIADQFAIEHVREARR